jgi:hypothetical protein
MTIPVSRQEYIDYVQDYRERHGGSAYEIVNGMVEASENARVEGWAVYMLSKALDFPGAEDE